MGWETRVGIGYDIHRLVDGGRLVLGGVAIPSEKGLIGHSDADVVLHAVIDALLGAVGLPDIGDLFPDTDPQYRGADSRVLLGTVVRRVRETGWSPHNIDVIVHAETPKLSPFKASIAEVIATDVELPPGAVSVKAKTNEGLGALGHKDAIACTAVCTVRRAEL
jgi:2-C-methyl-D-erythritol 2,4-cyclodiphosphate synthase